MNDTLTYSSGTTLCQCTEKYRLRYEEELAPVKDDMTARVTGTLFHKALEMFAKDGMDVAMAYLHTCQPDGLGHEILRQEGIIAKTKAMVRAAAERWPVPLQFAEKIVEMDVVNPDTTGVSRTFVFKGKVDGVCGNAIVDFKTVADPSRFIQQKTIGYQTELYALALSREGIEITQTIYRLITRPTIRPHLATPHESRKYTKAGALYATQREDDESPSMFEARCFEWLMQPGKITEEVRPVMPARMTEAKRWIWGLSKQLLNHRATGFWPRNEHACFLWNRPCEYMDICQIASGGGDVSSIIEASYTKKISHSELLEEAPSE